MKKIEKVSKLGIRHPHTFTKKNKEDHISIARSFLSRQRNYMVLKIIITGDEKWVFYNNVQWIDKAESSQPNHKGGGASWKKS